ncbi:hypothetical protein FIU83_04985 [Halomonas sp. THAF5a]|uniref:DUF6694 family lipoprotein n=1 Tax=Halomonas sp. THAF5a TaxID=2587844 RepID=UPI0012691926|nr:DUF6694 family lipoprotein [Halomonas sp. THAF5a]QFU00984.1 hypothetical protein FIU83_04985 [Halomonas sp. THAF5a]
MHISIRVLMLGMVLLLSGCSEPTVDASSEDAFYRSTGSMAEALQAEERDVFTDALMTVVMAGVDFSSAPGEPGQLDLAEAMTRLDGMTIDQVMAEAEALHRRQGAAVRSGASRHDGPLDRPE